MNLSYRTIIIGDVHGCYDELCKLLTLVKYKPTKDRLIFVGDIINRGPNPKQCINLIAKYDAEVVLGNHEYYLLKSIEDNEIDWNVYIHTKKHFGNDFIKLIDTIQSWPYWIKDDLFFVVHAGIDVNKPIEKTNKEFLVSVRQIQDINGNLIPWYNNYSNKKLIIFGHWAKLGGVIRNNLVGLDLGCVYGNKLRAIVLPNKEIFEVNALKCYFKN